MKITQYYENLELVVEYVEHTIDAYFESSGHYTLRTDTWYIETITHKGEDITDIVAEHIFKHLENEVNNA